MKTIYVIYLAGIIILFSMAIWFFITLLNSYEAKSNEKVGYARLV